MILSNYISKATQKLEVAGIGTARLDALVLLCDVLGKERAQLLAHPELKLTTEQQNTLQKLLDRRVKHEPLAYIRGKTEFYGREFAINHSVLEPRPESETMIELLKTHHKFQNFETIIDVGTGSGALAITAKLELPKTNVYAIDIDPECLEVAQQNAKKYSTAIEFLQGNLAEPLIDKKLTGPIAVLANLPYVPDDYHINEAAMLEPSSAIFGGLDGLDLYRTMFTQLKEHVSAPTHVFTESLPFQHHGLATIARAHNYVQIAKEDFIQVFEKA